MNSGTKEAPFFLYILHSVKPLQKQNLYKNMQKKNWRAFKHQRFKKCGDSWSKQLLTSTATITITVASSNQIAMINEANSCCELPAPPYLYISIQMILLSGAYWNPQLRDQRQVYVQYESPHLSNQSKRAASHRGGSV